MARKKREKELQPNIKVRLDRRTVITVRDQEKLEFWKEKYPALEVLEAWVFNSPWFCISKSAVHFWSCLMWEGNRVLKTQKSNLEEGCFFRYRTKRCVIKPFPEHAMVRVAVARDLCASKYIHSYFATCHPSRGWWFFLRLALGLHSVLRQTRFASRSFFPTRPSECGCFALFFKWIQYPESCGHTCPSGTCDRFWFRCHKYSDGKLK